MSMDELAARVGISKPTLYSIFPTKEDLLVETIVHGMDRVAAVIQADQTQRSPLQHQAHEHQQSMRTHWRAQY